MMLLLPVPGRRRREACTRQHRSHSYEIDRIVWVRPGAASQTSPDVPSEMPPSPRGLSLSERDSIELASSTERKTEKTFTMFALALSSARVTSASYGRRQRMQRVVASANPATRSAALMTKLNAESATLVSTQQAVNVAELLKSTPYATGEKQRSVLVLGRSMG